MRSHRDEHLKRSFTSTSIVLPRIQIRGGPSSHLRCMPSRSPDIPTNFNSAPPLIHSLRHRISAPLCRFCTRVRVRPLFLALLLLWLALFTCSILYWSSLSPEALPSSITGSATPGSTHAFSLHPDPSHPPTCTSLVFALSHSSDWLQASHPHPSLESAMTSCVPSAAAAALQRLGLRPLSMRVSPSGAQFWTSGSSAPVAPSDAQLFYTVLGAISSRSSACSGLVRAVDNQSASSFIFLLR